MDLLCCRFHSTGCFFADERKSSENVLLVAKALPAVSLFLLTYSQQECIIIMLRNIHSRTMVVVHDLAIVFCARKYVRMYEGGQSNDSTQFLVFYGGADDTSICTDLSAGGADAHAAADYGNDG